MTTKPTPEYAGHRYGGAFPPGSCYSCGGRVEWWLDLNGYPIDICPSCGPVEYVVIERYGTQVHCFMTSYDCEGERKLAVLTKWRLRQKGRRA